MGISYQVYPYGIPYRDIPHWLFIYLFIYLFIDSYNVQGREQKDT